MVAAAVVVVVDDEPLETSSKHPSNDKLRSRVSLDDDDDLDEFKDSSTIRSRSHSWFFRTDSVVVVIVVGVVADRSLRRS